MNAVAHAHALASADSRWSTEVHAIAGGWLVLSGPGLYVNRAMAAGLDTELSIEDLDFIVERSNALSLVPSIDVSPATQHGSFASISSSGFVRNVGRDVTALTRPIPDWPVKAPGDVLVRHVTRRADLEVWQETSAIGWGHADERARRASDAFAAAAHAVDQEGMVLAIDGTDGRVLGCASTTIRDGLATLGAMSTVPGERRRGVHAALIGHRLDHARRMGCELAAATAMAGGASQRNLERNGFTSRFAIATYELPEPI